MPFVRHTAGDVTDAWNLDRSRKASSMSGNSSFHRVARTAEPPTRPVSLMWMVCYDYCPPHRRRF